jgi:hypothetical protein
MSSAPKCQIWQTKQFLKERNNRFHREQNQLVKIGYRKSDRRTYEQRSPKGTLDQLVAVLTDLGKGGHLFTTDSLIPPAEPRMEGIPSYQIYLCLGFLVRRGLVRRHGRQGYAIEGIKPRELPAAVAAAWEALAARRVA